MEFDVLAIAGPTASGKTAVSVELAKQLGGEVINGDAMQVYQGLDIGTAKIKESEMMGVPHHLFDINRPDESFSAADYQREVRACIEDVKSRGAVPIICGGTGLYIQSVLFDFRFTEQAGDPAVRAALEEELIELGAAPLYSRLVKMDPESAASIHPNNHRRLIRALEIIEVTGKTKSSHEDKAGQIPLYKHMLFGLQMDKGVLYERINKRVDMMMDEGLLEEAKWLWDAGIRNVQSVQAIGYKELYSYFEGHLSLEEAIDLIKKNTRNYAKRQMTYFRNKMDIKWFEAEKGKEVITKEILQYLKDFGNLSRM